MNKTKQDILTFRIKELRALKMKLSCKTGLCERELKEVLAELKRLNEEERKRNGGQDVHRPTEESATPEEEERKRNGGQDVHRPTEESAPPEEE